MSLVVLERLAKTELVSLSVTLVPVQRLAVPLTPRVVLLAMVPLVPMVIRLHQVMTPVVMLVPGRTTAEQQMESPRVEVRKVKAQGQVLRALEPARHQETVLDQTALMDLDLDPVLVQLQVMVLVTALLMVPQVAMALTMVLDLEQTLAQVQARIPEMA